MPSAAEFTAIRQYCAHSGPTCGEDVLCDAVIHGSLGAWYLVQLVCEVRHNRRSRRTLGEVRTQMTRVRSQRARWVSVLGHAVFSVWRVLHRQARPMQQLPQQVTRLSRHQRRLLRPTGLVPNPEVSLATTAGAAARDVWNAVRGRQCVVWMDNFVRLRWGTDPTRPSYTQNLTALAVLVLDDLDTRDVRTRAATVPWFPGHPELRDVLSHLPWASALCCTAADKLHRVVAALNRTTIDHSSVRVPLDVQRRNVQSLGWRPLSLTEQNVSATEDLLRLLRTTREVQEHSGRQLPLLVDENIHYRVLRLLYSGAMVRYDVARYLSEVPLLYGVWHAYKHTLTVVYRAFLPVLGQLEVNAHMRIDVVTRSYRRVAFMEKMVAALLLSRDTQSCTGKGFVSSCFPDSQCTCVPSHVDVSSVSLTVFVSSREGLLAGFCLC